MTDNGEKNSIAPCLWAALVLALPAGVQALPVDTSGSVGYSFRSLKSDNNQKTVSNQLLGSVFANAYLWEPWLAQIQGGLTLALDKSKAEDKTTSASTDSRLLTGELGLNVLQQSMTPFRLHYLKTDSRVSDVTITNPLITLTNEEFSTHQLELNQAYVMEGGHRLQARYDTRRYSSNSSGSYDDTLLGVDVDLRPERQHLLAKASTQTTENSLSGRQADNTILDVDHFYFPSDALRLDSKVSWYNFDTTFNTPNSILNTTTTKISQASSFAFWRPQDSPWTVSGGLRVYKLSGETSVQINDQVNVTGTAGAFYQFSQHLRFDMSAAATYTDTFFGKTTTSRERGGALYQSDLYPDLFGWDGWTYQWYTSGAAENRDESAAKTRSLQAAAGHEAERTWRPSEFSYWRLSLNQGVNGSLQNQDAIGATTNTTEQRLDHSMSLAWNQSAWQGTTMAELTLSDSRDFGDQRNHQQLANFQASRTQTLSRLSTLSGHVTLQSARQDFYMAANESTVTTATGNIDYDQHRIFGLMMLNFRSNYSISRASNNLGLNRWEWENRLDYQVGMLDTSLSLRLMDVDSRRSDLLYFRVARRF